MTFTPRYYHGRPYAAVSVRATAHGVEVAVFRDDPADYSTVSTCLISCADFAQLISDGDAVLTAARSAREEPPF